MEPSTSLGTASTIGSEIPHTPPKLSNPKLFVLVFHLPLVRIKSLGEDAGLTPLMVGRQVRRKGGVVHLDGVST